MFGGAREQPGIQLLDLKTSIGRRDGFNGPASKLLLEHYAVLGPKIRADALLEGPKVQ